MQPRSWRCVRRAFPRFFARACRCSRRARTPQLPKRCVAVTWVSVYRAGTPEQIMSRAEHSIISPMIARLTGRPVQGFCLMLVFAVTLMMAGESYAGAEELTAADHVIVRKAERKLFLYRGHELLGSYRISLGLNPVGH